MRALAAAGFAAILISCHGSDIGPVKRYQLRGEILALNANDHTATIKHDKIEGWMEAMTMEFPVKDHGEFGKLAVGQRITATVFVSESGPFWIGEIKPASDAPRSQTRAIPAGWRVRTGATVAL